MTVETISCNLRMLRNAMGITQKQLAEAAGLSRPAYIRIESGKTMPRVSTLQSIARALDVKLQDLVAHVEPVRAIRFRSRKKMKGREQIIADVSRWLADFNFLEDTLAERPPYLFSNLAEASRRKKDPVRKAVEARKVLGLDEEEPIRNICGLLESSGIKVYLIKRASDDFFGLSVAPADGGPAIIINTWERISVERWIFTAAHELGHLLMHLYEYDVKQSEENKEEEAEANLFASYFLMPHASFKREWQYTYGLAFLDRVLKVKRIYKVSYRTVLYCLSQDRQYGNQVWARFQAEYKKRTQKTLGRKDEPRALSADNFRASFPESRSADEPERLAESDFIEDRLDSLVRLAIENEKITLSRGAEILRLDIQSMRERALAWV